MSWNKYLLLTLGGMTFLSYAPVFAEAEKKDAAAEGEKHYSGRQTEEWLHVQSQLTTLKGKVENQKKIVEDLILKKETQKGKDFEDTLTSLKEAHIEWVRLVGEFNKVNDQFLTKFPEKGATVGRIYKRIDPANIEVLENKMTLDGRLKKLESAIKRQYTKVKASSNEGEAIKPSGPNATQSKARDKKPAQAVSPAQEQSSGHQVTDQIVLEK